MREPGCSKARQRNEGTASPFWSSGQINHSHGNLTRPPWKPLSKRHESLKKKSRNKIKEVGEWKWRTKFLLFLRPTSHQTPSGHHSAVFCEGDKWQVVDEHHPPIPSSKSSNSPSGHQEWCICQLSSSLKSHSPKKASTAFLPGVVQQPGFTRKTFWCSSHTQLVIHISTGILLKSSLRCGSGQTECKRHIYWCYNVQKQPYNLFLGCQNSEPQSSGNSPSLYLPFHILCYPFLCRPTYILYWFISK